MSSPSVSDLVNKNADLVKENADLKKKLAAFEKEIARLENDNGSQRMKYEALLDKNRREIEALCEKNTALCKENTALSKENTELCNEYAEISKERDFHMEAGQQEIRILNKMLNATNEDLAATKAECTIFEAKNAAITQELSRVNSQFEDATKLAQDFHDELIRNKDKLTRNTATVNEFSAIAEMKHQECENLQKKLAETEEQFDVLFKQSQNELVNTRAELCATRCQLNEFVCKFNSMTDDERRKFVEQ
jgi:chromosome segregation ATPase